MQRFSLALLTAALLVQTSVSQTTVYVADFEDGEVNPGKLGEVANTAPYPSGQPTPFGQVDAYGWQNRAALHTTGDTTIVDSVAYSGANAAEVGNRFLRSDVELTLQAGFYRFRFWYLVPNGNNLTFYNKIIFKDQTNDEMLFTLDENTTAPAADVWLSRSFFVDTTDYLHAGETIDLRFGAIFADGGDPNWVCYTDAWSIVYEPAGSGFIDVTDAVGLDAYVPSPDPNDSPDVSAAWGDFNRDGWVDLYLGTNNAGSPGLFENVAGAGFVARDVIPWSNLSGLFVDYDNTGWPDIVTSKAGGHISRHDAGQLWTWLPDLEEPHPYQSEVEAWADFDNDGDLDCYRAGWSTGPNGPHFPDAIFTNQAYAHLALTWVDPSPADYAPARSATCADFDEDGDVDIYVSNYFLAANRLWINDGTGNFTEKAADFGVDADETPCSGYPGAFTTGSAWGDLDNDGHLDLVVGNLSHGDACEETPRFYRNMGPPAYHFEDVSATVGLPFVQSHSSPALADFDNDGDLDVFITAASGEGYPGEPSTLLRNDGDWNFTDVSAANGLDLATPKTNFQAAWGDFDNDGDMDLVTGRRLYMNPLANGNHWLMVKLEGDGVAVNRDAIGAQVRIDIGGGKVLTRQVENSIGWGNQNDPRLHFGLGALAGPVDVQVTWPDGATETISAVAVDQILAVKRTPANRGKDDMLVYRPVSTDPAAWFATSPRGAPTYWDDADGIGGPLEMPVDTFLEDFGQANDVARLGDVTGDGLDDLVVLHAEGGAYRWSAAHTIDGGGGVGELSDATVSTFWPAGDVGRFVHAFLTDITGDGAADALLTEAYAPDPNFILWVRYDSIPTSGLDLTGSQGLIWGNLLIDGEPSDRPLVGDFTGDGYADIGVYRNHPVYGSSVQILISKSDGSGFGDPFNANEVAVTPFGVVGEDYRFFVGDFDGDAFGAPADDICFVWKSEIDGAFYWTWQILWNDPSDPGYFIASYAYVWGVASDEPYIADVNGDSHVDLCARRCEPATGRMQHLAVFTDEFGYPAGQDLGGLILVIDDDGEFGACSTDTPLIGDLDTADDADELVVFSGAAASWHAQYAWPEPDLWADDVVDTSLYDFGFASNTPIGGMADLPLVGDVNGDGVDDVVFRTDDGGSPPTTAWHAGHTALDPNTSLGMLSAAAQSTLDGLGGPMTDVVAQFLADVNGDGADDAVSVDGGFNWRAAHSLPGFGLSDLTVSPAAGVSQFGLPGDLPLTGDFDGDGIVDICVYRPSNGYWYVRRSTIAGITLDAAAGRDVGGQWGGPSWSPLVGDFNGDGRDDGVVYGDPEGDDIWNVGIVYATAAGVVHNTNSPHWLNFGIVSLGDELFIADVNSDGRDDLCVRRPLAGDRYLWYAVLTPPSGMPPNGVIDESAYFGNTDTDIPLIGQFDLPVVANVEGDVNGDGVVDVDDMQALLACLQGPDVLVASSCLAADLDGDDDVDVADVGRLQALMTGS